MSVAEACNDGINWGLKILNGLISPVLLPTVHIPSPRQVPCHSYSIFFSLFWYLQHPCIAIAIQVLHSKLHRMASQGLVGGTLTLTHIVQIKWLSRTLMKASITLSMLDFLYLQNYLGTARPPPGPQQHQALCLSWEHVFLDGFLIQGTSSLSFSF